MKLDAMKHNIKWGTWSGKKYRDFVTWLGVKLMRKGRKLIKRGGGRCSWCGANCGFDSTINIKGMRCSSLDRDCTSMPDA